MNSETSTGRHLRIFSVTLCIPRPLRPGGPEGLSGKATRGADYKCGMLLLKFPFLRNYERQHNMRPLHGTQVYYPLLLYIYIIYLLDRYIRISVSVYIYVSMSSFPALQ